MGLSASLASAGFKMGRLQTGTPARLDKTAINFTDPRFELQPGDENPHPFSYLNRTVDNAVSAPISFQPVAGSEYALLRTIKWRVIKHIRHKQRTISSAKMYI